ncbi:6-carboxytetrahydropterin synthase [Microlunatus sp. Gsoil 973]|jgi:6-pyruvoyl-tetrahydropterin synthase|uniref:6-pyruvoyl trahydropterin synthase family protein n=1 Tax=Microlunatus sp. Gsoil 973 TaxID=2672569 RepID=UPI0012B4583C|nr:6-carboxytetrahydropterin synthase [Microlunatus sp. Gsoil 973]QGN34308.1 6-carboxytetrahydropterin synthase [Microlunatus sp. Gsoil 973]
MTFSVTVSDHIMIAHRLRGEQFGPAQGLHGATFAVEASFVSPELKPDGTVIDMTAAAAALQQVLSGLNYRNLDDLPEFDGINTTTEVLARYIADGLADQLATSDTGTSTGTSTGGPTDAGRLSAIEVVLHESPSARAGYVKKL